MLVRNRGGGKLDSARPSVRREVERISRALADTRYVGHVTNPLRDRRDGVALIERNGRSLVITAACPPRTSRATAARRLRTRGSGPCWVMLLRER
ncbi:MAG: hypothetical protein ACRDKY_00715 [Solirubrobacteraceae bacterium]